MPSFETEIKEAELKTTCKKLWVFMRANGLSLDHINIALSYLHAMSPNELDNEQR